MLELYNILSGTVVGLDSLVVRRFHKYNFLYVSKRSTTTLRISSSSIKGHPASLH